ncbi:MAG: hypothetical protein Q9219_002597 [cf. Caloplaca sp. 3 TL-2023]
MSSASSTASSYSPEDEQTTLDISQQSSAFTIYDDSLDAASFVEEHAADKPSSEGRAGIVLEDQHDRKLEDLLSRIKSNTPPHCISQLGSLQKSNGEASDLDTLSLTREISKALNKSVDGLLVNTVEAIRKAFEAKLKKEVQAEWGSTVQRWLKDHEDEQRRAIAAEFDDQYKQEWFARNLHKVTKELENRGEAAYQRVREWREREAEKRWEEDSANLRHQMKAQLYYQVKAELRQELEKGVAATLRAEHIERLREEARQDIINDKARYDRNMLFAKDVFSRLPAHAASGASGNGLFGIYRPNPNAQCENGNLAIPGGATAHDERREIGSVTGGASYSSATQPVSLLPAINFDRPLRKRTVALGEMLPPPRPGALEQSQRMHQSNARPAEGHTQHKPPQQDSLREAQRTSPQNPIARVHAASHALQKQVNGEIPGIRTSNPNQGQEPRASLHSIDLNQQEEVRRTLLDPWSNKNLKNDGQARERGQSDQQQHDAPNPRTTNVPSIDTGKKRGRSLEDVANNEATIKDNDPKWKGSDSKRPRLESRSQDQGMSTRTRAAIKKNAGRTIEAGETEETADLSKNTAIAPSPLAPRATAATSVIQPSQSLAGKGEEPAARCNPLKRCRNTQKTRSGEDEEPDSPPSVKKIRGANTKSNTHAASLGTATTITSGRLGR